MSDIVEARRILNELHGRLTGVDARYVEQALILMRRRPYARAAAPVQSVKIDAEAAAAIRQFARANPGLTQQTIAEQFGCTAGRVSEALHGLR